MAETTSRTLELLNLLQSHRQWSGSELSDRLGVTARTLRRDIDRVRELGYRVEAARGPQGGYRLEAGGSLPPLLLTNEEAVTMAIGLRLAAQQGLVDGELTTQTALAKFEQVLPSALRSRVNALAVTVQSESPRVPTVSGELLGALALACRDHERVRFSYEDARGQQTERVIEPHALVAASRAWFLVAWDLRRNDWRTFRVDRMARLFGTRLRFVAREIPGGAAEYVARSVTALRRNVRLDVLLQMSLEAARSAFGPWASQAERVNDGLTRWRIEAETPEHAFGALAWIPAGVGYTLEGEPDLVEFVKRTAERVTRSR
ncbi:MAG TPA: YafY family protein [Galbitalea sp.]|jgi:predicted DNA-binding transcriptional regulator YafY|nr:YafY family protein [Galbitalea sp.]